MGAYPSRWDGKMETEPGERTEETSADVDGGASPPVPEAGMIKGAATESAGAPAGNLTVASTAKPAAGPAVEPAVKSDAVSAVKSDAENSAAPRRRLTLSVLLCAALVSSFIYLRRNPELLGRLQSEAGKAGKILTGRPAPPPDPYAEAVSKVEGDRGEDTGRKAKVDIPAELKQYKDPHRFLAIQKAAADESGIKSPHDFAELAQMIVVGRELVEVPRLGRGYVLYGVGLTATGELTHFDREQKRSVPLFAGDEELKAYEDGLAAECSRLEAESKELEGRLKEVGKKEREARAQLLADITARKKELDAARDREKLIAAYYGKTEGRRRLFGEYEVLAGLARDFGGRAYDLHDTASAREFEARLLSFIRPAALSVLEELASAYQSKFERPLAVTSLVRTEEYQRLLRESGNPNAADVAPPPHTTGLAFDIYYRFMTAAEQEFVMSEVARLEQAGRVEALRELRDHYHVFVFPDGHGPSEKLVEETLRKEKKKS
jgi:hypothetical protein